MVNISVLRTKMASNWAKSPDRLGFGRENRHAVFLEITDMADCTGIADPTPPDRGQGMTSGFVKTCSYTELRERLESFTDRNILIQNDESTVIVYQTFCPEITEYAVNHGYFGGPLFDFDRTTWLKLSFIWTMIQSEWATKTGRDRVLAIRIDKTFFLEMIDFAVSSGIVYQTPPGKVDSEAVTLLWTPDYNIDGDTLDRHTLLVGLRTYMMRKLNNTHIIDIVDITDFATKQALRVLWKYYSILLVPTMDKLTPASVEVCRKLMLDGFYCTPPKEELDKIIEMESHRKSKGKRDIVLFLQGSFNPIHTKHVQIMQECKEWVEKETGNKVILGIMGVNTDKLLNDKIDKKENGEGLVITKDHRVELCKLATCLYEWIHVHDMHKGKPKSNIDDEIKQLFENNPRWLYVFGADKQVGEDVSKLTDSLIIGRQGVPIWSSVKNAKLMKRNWVHVIPVELENVSSTEIRKEFKRVSCMDTREEKRVIIDQLVEKGWLDANVGDYVLDNESELYEYSTA